MLALNGRIPLGPPPAITSEVPGPARANRPRPIAPEYASNARRVRSKVVSIMKVLLRCFSLGGSRDWIFLEQTRHQRRVNVRATTDDGLAIECEHHAVAVVEPHPVFRR